MSVLNQVLRDVKQREQSTNSSPLAAPPLPTAKPKPGYRKWLLLVGLSVGLGAAGAWLVSQWRTVPEAEQVAEKVQEVTVEPEVAKLLTPSVVVLAQPETPPVPVIEPEPKPQNLAPEPLPEPEPVKPKTVQNAPKPAAKPAPKPAPDPVPVSMPKESKLQVTVDAPSAEDLARAALSKGQMAMQRGQLAQAEQLLLEALEHQPSWVLARQVLAQVYATGQRYDDALDQLAGIAPPVSQHLDFYQLRGALAQQLQAYELAKRSYEALLGVDASQGRWWLGLALACDGLGARQQALQAYSHAMASRQLSAASAQYAQQRLDILR